SPSIEHAKHFANNIEGVAGGPPPVGWIEGISFRRANNGSTVVFCERVPQPADAARVRFGRDENDHGALRTAEFRGDHANFVRGTVDGRLEHMDSALRYAFMLQDASAEDLLPSAGDIQRPEGSGRLQ